MKKKIWLYAIVSGILFGLAWPIHGFPFLLFIAFVPLLFLEEILRTNPYQFKKRSALLYSYPAFFLFNVLTTWWIVYASAVGAILAFVINGFLMALIFLVFHLIRQKTNAILGAIALITLWTTYEYGLMNGELTWTWIDLGNAFSHYPSCIQWYEYTGVLGGTWWILIVNVLIFESIKTIKEYSIAHTKSKKLLVITGLVIFIPLIFSIIRYNQYTETGIKANVTAVQPNIDPYNEKFDGATFKDQMYGMYNLAKANITPQTNYVLFPETAIAHGIWEDELNNSPAIDLLQSLADSCPTMNIITGASTYRMYLPGEIHAPSARKSQFCDSCWFESYNTALCLDSSTNYQFYHKSQLVAGVETLPYPAVFNALQEIAFNLGGTTGSLGIQKDRTPFISKFKQIKVAPSICYESLFGEFTSEYVKNGAQAIFIITNDGWWQDTPGYKQHFDYARLRAIETRKDVVQCANTGISGFINQRGDILQQTTWWVPVAINGDIQMNEIKTVYVRFGDYIGYLSVMVTIGLIVFTTIKIILKR